MRFDWASLGQWCSEVFGFLQRLDRGSDDEGGQRNRLGTALMVDFQACIWVQPLGAVPVQSWCEGRRPWRIPELIGLDHRNYQRAMDRPVCQLMTDRVERLGDHLAREVCHNDPWPAGCRLE